MNIIFYISSKSRRQQEGILNQEHPRSFLRFNHPRAVFTLMMLILAQPINTVSLSR